ncbi:MAG: aminotransferase class I/II-fold pyridoxal phosphate-dependent enzyme [Bacteroidota bacterium]
MENKQGFATRAIREQMERTSYREHSTPLFMTSSFTFPTAEQMQATFAGEEDGIIYSRYNNPTVDELITKMCTLEGAEAGFATASGMSAVFSALMALVRNGDHIIATRAVFGSTHQILTSLMPRWGVSHTYVEPDQPENWEAAIRPESKILLLETPSNPGLALVDLAAASAFARKYDLIMMVDNCFATPYLQRPLEYGAHLVMHSATKWIDGQGRSLGGLILGNQALMDEIIFFCRHTGPALSPFNAWLLSKSLETLAIRMEAHCTSALKLAQWLENQEAISEVSYPFLKTHAQYELAQQQMKLGGGIITCTFKGGAKAAMRFVNELQLVSRSSNLGDTRTIVTHPTSTTHSKLKEEERLAVGITPGLLRISVGLEDLADIQADFERAFASCI